VPRSFPLLTLAVATFSALPARAEESVEVTVVAIVASERSTDIHPKLKTVAREVQKVDPKLTGFRLARATRRRVAVGVKESFPLIDCKDAAVTVRKSCGKDGRVELTVKPPLVGEITYTTCCEKYFPIVTRYQTEDKDRLIVAIMVEPCKNKKK
jgi:hypothetical protein